MVASAEIPSFALLQGWLTMKHTIRIRALILILAALTYSSAVAQTRKAGPMAKVARSLAALHEQYRTHLTQGIVAPYKSNDPRVRLTDDRVVIDAVASGDVQALKADLVFLG